jgi:hypothetical protein
VTQFKPSDDYLFRAMLILIVVLSTADAALTIAWVTSRTAVEANPFLSDLLAPKGSVIPFLAVKTVLVVGGCWLLWRWRRRPLAVAGGLVALLFFVYAVFYHLSMLGPGFMHWLKAASRP